MADHGEREGQQLGNYRLTRLLGRGGFAEVYVGEHVHLGTEAAIKVLVAWLASGEIEPFRDEARTIAHLRHPILFASLTSVSRTTCPFW
jgi:serine/threonine protein kinase